MAMTFAEDNYGLVAEPATLTIERRLPGPIDRIWSYLIDSELRSLWLAAGAIEEKAGAPVELVWRNDALTDPPGDRPEGLGDEDRMICEVTAIAPPHRLAISWGGTGGVTFTLEDQGGEVLLTIVHRRVENPSALLDVSAGWHAHLDVLEARLRNAAPRPHWDNYRALRAEYARRLTN